MMETVTAAQRRIKARKEAEAKAKENREAAERSVDKQITARGKGWTPPHERPKVSDKPTPTQKEMKDRTESSVSKAVKGAAKAVGGAIMGAAKAAESTGKKLQPRKRSYGETVIKARERAHANANRNRAKSARKKADKEGMPDTYGADYGRKNPSSTPPSQAQAGKKASSPSAPKAKTPAKPKAKKASSNAEWARKEREGIKKQKIRAAGKKVASEQIRASKKGKSKLRKLASAVKPSKTGYASYKSFMGD